MRTLIKTLKSPAVKYLLGAIYLILFFLVSSLHILSATEKDKVMKIRVDDQYWLGFDEAASLARRFDTMVDKIEEANFSPPSANININNWTHEITPMFMYEELVTQTNAKFDFMAVPLVNGFDHNQIGGRSDCRDYVLINARYQNDISSWFEKGYWPVVLAHEIAHAQQGNQCSREYNSTGLIENTAQIMAWEVMAALGNQGSTSSILALVYELRGTALSAASAMSKFENRQDDYDKLIEDIIAGEAGRLSARAKRERFWTEDPDKLQALQMRYSWTPLNLVFKARNEGTIYQLALDNDTHSAEIDDILYFIEHMEELVDWALDESREEKLTSKLFRES